MKSKKFFYVLKYQYNDNSYDFDSVIGKTRKEVIENWEKIYGYTPKRPICKIVKCTIKEIKKV